MNFPAQIANRYSRKIKTRQHPNMQIYQYMNRHELKIKIKSKLIAKTSLKVKNKNRRLFSHQLCGIVQEQTFLCVICLEIMINPCITQCGHCLCLHCAQNAFLYSKYCSTCRSPINNYYFQCSTNLRQLIDEYVKIKASSWEKASYAQRLKLFEDNQHQRCIVGLTVGLKIDYFSCIQNQWREGYIFKIDLDNNFDIELIVKDRRYKQDQFTFNSSSRKIAKLNYFTHKPKIRKFIEFHYI